MCSSYCVVYFQDVSLALCANIVLIYLLHTTSIPLSVGQCTFCFHLSTYFVVTISLCQVTISELLASECSCAAAAVSLKARQSSC